MNTINDKQRFLIIDLIRGGTILLMFVFHITFDLNYFKIININILEEPFWYFLPRLIVFLFFFAVGMSLKIAHFPQIHWKLFFKRQLKLGLCALGISVVTKILFPQNWIYFGTLHCIFFISFFGLFFNYFDKLGTIIGLLLFIPSITLDKNLPFFELPIQSFDYISPFPWIGAMLFGIYSIRHKLHLIPVLDFPFKRQIAYLGKHSLPIYLIHQPILFSIIYLISKIYH